jgi:hypothetical protein
VTREASPALAPYSPECVVVWNSRKFALKNSQKFAYRRAGTPTTSKGPRPGRHKAYVRDTRLRLWPGQLLARLVLSLGLGPLLCLFLLLGWLIGLKLGGEHGEYDPDQTQGPKPGR